MKRITLKSSTKMTALVSSSFVTALFMGQTAFAGPDKQPAEAEDTTVERIIVEEAEKTDATAMPNAAIEGDVELAPAETIESDFEVILEPDAAETDAEPAEEAVEATETDASEDAETIVIENPEAVIISNPDADAEATEEAGEVPEKP